jgi:hypothetical protein
VSNANLATGCSKAFRGQKAKEPRALSIALDSLSFPHGQAIGEASSVEAVQRAFGSLQASHALVRKGVKAPMHIGRVAPNACSGSALVEGWHVTFGTSPKKTMVIMVKHLYWAYNWLKVTVSFNVKQIFTSSYFM